MANAQTPVGFLHPSLHSIQLESNYFVATHGDRCQNNNDCQPRGSQSRLLARMRCRQTASYYFSNSVDTCQCATVINGGYDELGAYVVPNRHITVATGHNTSTNTYTTIPVRLNDTGSEDMPVSYWCLGKTRSLFFDLKI